MLLVVIIFFIIDFINILMNKPFIIIFIIGIEAFAHLKALKFTFIIPFINDLIMTVNLFKFLNLKFNLIKLNFK